MWLSCLASAVCAFFERPANSPSPPSDREHRARGRRYVNSLSAANVSADDVKLLPPVPAAGEREEEAVAV